PDLLRADAGEVDRRGALHSRGLGGVRVERRSRNDLDAVDLPVDRLVGVSVVGHGGSYSALQTWVRRKSSEALCLALSTKPNSSALSTTMQVGLVRPVSQKPVPLTATVTSLSFAVTSFTSRRLTFAKSALPVRTRR